MMSFRRHLVLAAFLPWGAGCESAASEGAVTTGQARAGQDAPASDTALVGYDLRRIRPGEEPLRVVFDRVRQQALAEGKQVAVLFSADWCDQCRALDLALGKMHPERAIGHVRILQLKEEDWESAGRVGEFNDLRVRWQPTINTYPLFVLLDREGGKVEEMRDAIERLEAQGLESTVNLWFESVRSG